MSGPATWRSMVEARLREERTTESLEGFLALPMGDQLFLVSQLSTVCSALVKTHTMVHGGDAETLLDVIDTVLIGAANEVDGLAETIERLNQAKP